MKGKKIKIYSKVLKFKIVYFTKNQQKKALIQNIQLHFKILFHKCCPNHLVNELLPYNLQISYNMESLIMGKDQYG
jgi:hypothetical protein